MSKKADWKGDVVVIGGGWSGMLVAKHCREHGLKVRILEQSDFLGGVWKYQEDTPGGVMSSTQTTSSWSFTEISDFPLTEADGLNTDFPKHDVVQAYLERYAAHNHLPDVTSFNCKAVRAIKDADNNFNVYGSDGNLYISRRLCVSTGFLGIKGVFYIHFLLFIVFLNHFSIYHFLRRYPSFERL